MATSSTSLKDHKNFLTRLCRVCGEAIVLKLGYKSAVNVARYHDEFEEFYGVRVEAESEDEYPKLLCVACSKKLLRIKKNSGSNREPGFFPIAKFNVHNDEHCCVCEKSGSSQKAKDINLKKLDSNMLNAGFVKHNENGNFRRIFLRQTFNQESGRVTTKIALCLKMDNTYLCYVYGKPVDLAKLALPRQVNDEAMFSSFFDKNHLCNGVDGYCDVINDRLEIKQPFPMQGNEHHAAVENEEHLALEEKTNYKYVRSVKCYIFVSNEVLDATCNECKRYGMENLRKFRQRLFMEPERKRKRVSDTSTTNMRYLSRDELQERLSAAQSRKREVMQQLSKVSVKVNQDISAEGTADIDEDQHILLSSIIGSNTPDFEEESPQWLLWQQQKLQASKTNSKGMKWHPLIIRWCLSIYLTSPAAYRQMCNKELNFLRLPCVTTLKQYINFTDVQTGFNPDIIRRLAIDANVKEASEMQRKVVLAFDEMQIKSNLVFHKATGKLVGFTEMGSLNEDIMAFQNRMLHLNDSFGRNLSTHALVYMVRGIFTSLAYPFGYFASHGTTSSQLYSCTMQAIHVLAAINLDVVAIVSDGAASNRKFYKLMTEDHWTKNPFNDDNKVYFFSDVPHLLKTTRNCLENSHWNKNVRKLELDGQFISWKHLVDLYEEDLGLEGRTSEFSLNVKAPGLRKLHKLTEDHITLTPRSRMTVKLAAQVLSQTTANALISQGRFDTKSTIKFIDIFDRVFDCLNVSKVNMGRFSKKELQPYKSCDDWRFKFLEEEFLNGFLERWEKQVRAKNNLEKEQQNRQLLSNQTIHGWRMTVSSFIDLAKELLQIEGVSFVLSEKFSQDPLEEHFGRQRRRGGCNDNPNILEFGRQELSINVIRSEMLRDIKGNTRGADREQTKLQIHEVGPLPRKSNKKK